MKPLYTRLQEARKRLGIPWEVLERDYILSWILAGITEVPALRDTLVFKGGTALKKCYFGDYRFSEDLDFSGMENVPIGEAMEEAMRETCEVAVDMLDEYAPVEILCERYMEREPHPEGQEAFAIRARLPWQRTPHTRVMVETAIDEKVLKPVQDRTVIYNYGEPLKVNVKTYALEEIIAEKLRAILQHVQQLHTRGWSRSRARDYYDLWRVLDVFRDQLNLSDFSPFLREKCYVRGVSFERADDFFQETMLKNVERTWDQWFGPLVPDLPAFGTVIEELYPQVASLIGNPP
jgi:predicted nucleotidyltransferase component of viral defense system